MPPTAIYKSRSLVMLAVIAELMSLMLPLNVKVSVAKVLEESHFNEYYCVCGFVGSTEQHLLFHLKCSHTPVHYVFLNLKSTLIPFHQLDFGALVD